MNKWTNDDISFIKENYLKIGVKECAKKLKRTENSIRLKSIKSGIYINKLTIDDISFLKENYLKIGVKECAKKLNKKESLIKNYANKLKIKKNNKWSILEINYLIENYGKITTKEIIKNLNNRTYNSITNKSIKLGLKTNRCELFQLKERKNKFDEYFFEDINIYSSYWAGFIAADGNVFKNCVSIKISDKDKSHLLKLKKILHFSGDIKYNINKKNNYKYCKLSFFSKKTITDLKNNFNIIPKKSLILEPPFINSIDCKLSFICGLLDGDGSIYYDDNDIYIKFLGTKKILEWIKQILSNYIKINNNVNNSGNIYTFGLYNKENVLNFFNLINTYNLPLLERKWEKLINYK